MQKIQDFINDLLEAQKNNLFLWTPFCFAIGIAIYFGLTFEPILWIGGLISLIFLLLEFFFYKHQDNNAFLKLGYILLIGCILMAAGFTAAQIRTHFAYTPMLLKKMTVVGLTGTIESIESLEDKQGSRVILNDLVIERLTPDETPRKIRMKVRKDEGLLTGQRIKLLGSLNIASPPVAPHAFDFQRMAFFEGIGAVGFSFTQPEILNLELKITPSLLSKIRDKISKRIQSETKPPQQAVIIALMTGQRAAINEDIWQALRVSGLAHLLAISGLHVGMVAGVIFFFSRLFMAFIPALVIHYPIKKWAAMLALIGALFYTLIVGATIPTQRALIMTALVMVAIMFDRSPFSMRLVALAALGVLAISPESLTSVSFQMSFAAVVALIYFYDWAKPFWIRLHHRAGFLRKFLLYFMGVGLTTLIAGTATGLFSLYHFQTYATFGLLANLVAVPLMAFVIMPTIVLTYIAMPFGLERLPLDFIEWTVGWVLATANWVSQIDGAQWQISTFPHWIFIGMVICAWFWIVWKGRFKLISIPLFFTLCLLIMFYKQPDILISSSSNLILNKGGHGLLWLSTGRKERYTADNWLRLYGQQDSKKNIWPHEGGKENLPMTCDTYGCRGEIENNKIAVSFKNKAWMEDCLWADIIISQTPIPSGKCKAPYIIDYFDTWRSGAHALWLTPETIKIQTVEEIRGLRPWTQTAANNKNSKKLINDKSE